MTDLTLIDKQINDIEKTISNNIEKPISNGSYSIDFSTPRCILLVGKPKRGKSNTISYFILKNSLDNKIFQFGMVISRTGRIGNEYNFIPDEYIHTEYKPSIINNLVETLEKNIQETGKVTPCFLILDDMLGLITTREPELLNLFSIMRHLGLTIFLAVQYVNQGSSTTLREVCTHAVMYNSKGLNTIKSLYESFGQLFENEKEFKTNFLDITKEDFTACLYDNDIDEVEDNYMIFKSPDMSNIDYKLEY